jgi:hypothetical protein
LGTVSGASKCRIKANLRRTRRYAGSVPPLPSDHLADPFAEPATTISNGTAELLCLISGLVLIALVWWLISRRGTGAKAGRPGPLERHDPTDPWAPIPTATMESDANTALVAADDALKTSEQELAFATAQYGTEATGEFGAALDASRADIMEAFRLKQLLDDDVPDDEPTKRDWFRQIIERCGAADRRLDTQVEAFDRLRDMESKVEPMIESLSARRAAAVDRLAVIDATYRKLVDSYASSALLPISHSATQFEERIKFADRSLAYAKASLASGNRPVAALGVRAAEEALGQMDMLLDGVDNLAASLQTASASVQSTLGQIESDVAAGKAAVAAAGVGSTSSSAGTVDLAATVAGAEQIATAVRAEMAAPQPDPFAALRRLEAANVRLSAALANIRDAATRAERARQMLETALPAARAEVSAAANFITTRRGAIGSAARTRLAEAQRQLDQAMTRSGTDPVDALSNAQQAESMAAQASRLANDDVNRWSQPQAFGGAMGGFGGAVLGGILLDSMTSGGRGGGFSTGFGWGGMIPGSFGGPGTRVRVRF